MLAGLTVKQKDLLTILDDLKLLQQFSKESLLVKLKQTGNTLFFTCKSVTTVYKNHCTVTVREGIGFDVTVLFPPMTDFWTDVPEVEIDVYETYSLFRSTNLSVTVKQAYEIMDDYVLDIEPARVQSLDTTSYSNLDKMLSISTLGNLFKQHTNIEVANNKLLVKFGNVWAQSECLAAPRDYALPIDMAHKFTRFKPESLFFKDANTLVLMRGTALLVLPITQCTGADRISVLSKSGKKPADVCTIVLGSYTKRLSLYTKLCKENATIRLYKKGLATVLTGEQLGIDAKTGDCSELLDTVRLPIDVWAKLVSLLSTMNDVTMWTEDNILWMKSYPMIIAVHVYC